MNKPNVLVSLQDEKEVRERLMKNSFEKGRRNPDHQNETLLTKLFLETYRSSEFPFAIHCEWEYYDEQTLYGEGDLVFSNTPNVVFMETREEPARILIVEVKHFNSNASTGTAKRQKVRDQVVRAMDCWHDHHPQDKVYGMIVTNVADNNYVKLPNVDVFISPMFQLDLLTPDNTEAHDKTGSETLQLYQPAPFEKKFGIPNIRACWGITMESHIDHSLWNAIKDAEFARTNFKCEFCCYPKHGFRNGELPKDSLTIHLAWQYDIESRVASFARFDVLCKVCHDFMHMGRVRGGANKNEKDPKAGDKRVNNLLNIYAEVKNIPLERAHKDHKLIWSEHHLLQALPYMDGTEWSVDLSGMHLVPAVRRWITASDVLKSKKKKNNEPLITASRKLTALGNCCCYRECNPQYTFHG